MPITVGGSTITFNDGTTQSTAAVLAPAAGAVGSIKHAIYKVGIPAPGSGTLPVATAIYDAGSTDSGANLCTDLYAVQVNNNFSSAQFVGTGVSTMLGRGNSNGTGRATVAFSFPTGTTFSGTMYSNFSYGAAIPGAYFNLVYNSESGSWRLTERLALSAQYDAYGNNTGAYWQNALWQRYA